MWPVLGLDKLSCDAITISAMVSLEDLHRGICQGVSSWRDRVVLANRHWDCLIHDNLLLILVQHTMLDVYVLQILDLVNTHIDLGSPLISHQLLLLSLLLGLVWL